MDMKTYLTNQIQEALKHKWCVGIKIGRDPGEEAINDWITNHAHQYRTEYEHCLEQLINQTLNKTKTKIQKVLDQKITPEQLKQITQILIEEFTKQWTYEITKPNPDKHINEI